MSLKYKPFIFRNIHRDSIRPYHCIQHITFLGSTLVRQPVIIFIRNIFCYIKVNFMSFINI